MVTASRAGTVFDNRRKTEKRGRGEERTFRLLPPRFVFGEGAQRFRRKAERERRHAAVDHEDALKRDHQLVAKPVKMAA